MKRARRKPPETRGAASSARPGAAPRAASRRGGLLAAGLVLGLAAVLAWKQPWRAVQDPLARIAPDAARAEGARLMNEGRSAEAVPYFDRALRADPSSPGLLRDRANALFNTLFESDTLAGVVMPHVAESDRRVALVQQALAGYQEAAARATSPAERAAALRDRANALVTWGFAWEAALAYRDAIALAPGDTALVRAGRELLDAVRFPSGLPTFEPPAP